MMDERDSQPVAVGGFAASMGIEVVSAAADKVVLRMRVDERHFQPMGIVHGGVYCGLVETACSIGGFMAAQPHGRMAVGLDNQTSFLKAVRDGVLTTTAVPLTGGRRTALWEARIEDERGQLVSVGRLRLLTVEPGDQLAGKAAGADDAAKT